jgi:hypothetical protein
MPLLRMLQRILRSTGRELPAWCALAMALLVLQPFLHVHFDADGLVVGQELSIRDFGGPVQFLPDEDASTPSAFETKLFVPAAANIDLPQAFANGIAAFLSLLLLIAPLRLLFRPPAATRFRSVLPRAVPNASGAPPPTLSWRSRPPKTAPPS